MNLYIASHVHHIEGVSAAKSAQLISTLYKHACDPKYIVAIEVRSPHLPSLIPIRSRKHISQSLLAVPFIDPH